MNQIVRYGEVRRGRLGIEMADLTPELAKKLGVTSLDGAAGRRGPARLPGGKSGPARGRCRHRTQRPQRSAARGELRAPAGTDAGRRASRTARAARRRPRARCAPGSRRRRKWPAARARPCRSCQACGGRDRARQPAVTSACRAAGWWFRRWNPAAARCQAGFRPGDIIYAVNRRRVQTVAEFKAALKSAERGFAVSLLRGDFSITITVH